MAHSSARSIVGRAIVVLVLAFAYLFTPAIGGGSAAPGPNASASWYLGPTHIALAAGQKLKIGFILVGSHEDFGYNQAVDQGRQALQKNLAGKVETIYQENVPESPDVERVMEQMIQEGCKIIFATSYGYLYFAMQVAQRHPDIVFLHQGGLKDAKNVGTYFGTIWQAVYAAGVAAGKMTKTNKLGFVGAFPIPQLLLNVNAFELGAQSVNPKATTTVVFTSAWCDAGKLADAANSLLDQGVDVMTEHEDCTKPVIETALKRGAYVVGYHADAGSIAGSRWITAAIWTWGDLYTKMVEQIMAGTWKSSIYRAGLKDHVVALAPFGPAVPASVRTLTTKVEMQVENGSTMPFKGPILDQGGKVEIKAGVIPTISMLESTTYLVKGVVGNLPH